MKTFLVKFIDGTDYWAEPDQGGWMQIPPDRPALDEPWFTHCLRSPSGRIRPKPPLTWDALAARVSDRLYREPRDYYSDWVEGHGVTAMPPDYNSNPAKYEVQFRSVTGEWFNDLKPFNGSWHYRVRLRQQARDYSEWVEGVGDSAKPPDFDSNTSKYEVQVKPPDGVWEWSMMPFHYPNYTYRVRTYRPEQPAPEPPKTTTVPEPPVLNSLIIRPDGCDLVVNGKAVAIPHSAALDLAGELCRSRRQ